uniref:Serine/threonine-protein kinase receptor n=2 Tax=Brugia TaxID=6278 RepID=A0A1I9G4J3_BRUMA|nr:BMA-DAF-1, isoform c [Brugia malayi]
MQTLSSFVFFLFVIVTRAIKDNSDPGYVILKFMERFQANLKEPINLSEELICNCSYSGCGEEITRFLGNNYTGLCRSTSGICHKRLLPDRSVILSCLSKDASPDLHCRAKQPMNDGSIMQCCQNYSFCNGALNLNPVNDYILDNNISFIHSVVIFLIGIAVFVFSIFLVFAWINKPLKRWLFYWTHHRSGEEHSEVTGEEKLLMNSTDALGHLSDLLYNLDDSATTGSGSGFPLLAQRTIARQIELQKEIGQGRFGEVWLGYWKGDEVAVKIFSSRDERSWNREVEIFQTNLLRHPNLLRFIASDNKDTGTSTQLWLITEYHEHGSLYDYLSANPVSESVMLQMIRSIAVGLSFLHNEIPGPRKPAIAHRDLKSKNILVKSDLTCVIADLGLAVRYMNGEINVPDNSKCGTVRYLAPEILEDNFSINHFETYKTADMYAMGLMIWEIMWRCGSQEESRSFELPYFDCVGRDPTMEEMKLCVCIQKRRPTVQEHWIDDKVMRGVLQIMQECWTESPVCRLTAMNVRKAVDRHAASLGWKVRS